MPSRNCFFTDIASFVYNPEVKQYPLDVPFDPPEAYPELPFVKKYNTHNMIYPMVRELLQKLGLDKKNIGTPLWNPFKDIIKPGNNILIKPNLVRDSHYLGDSALYSTIVHGSLIRPFIDYAHLALRGNGSITIAENPTAKVDFSRIMDFTGIQSTVEVLAHRGYKELNIIDLRAKILKEANDGSLSYHDQQGDPLGYIDINIGSNSLFSEFDNTPHIHYCTLADPCVSSSNPMHSESRIPDKYHTHSVHQYTFSKSVLDSDLIINIAKMKTHLKSGVTLTLKNIIGVVSGNACLPHWREGLPPDGDASPSHPPSYYMSMQKSFAKIKKYIKVEKFPGFASLRAYLQEKNVIIGQYKHLKHGNWKGNDTIWRTILDLNRIVMYADRDGKLHDTQQRKFFGIIDGIISQHGNGPMAGDPLVSSIVFAGFNPVFLDALAVKSMGIDYRLIKTISKACEIKKWQLLPDHADLSCKDRDVPVFNFKLPKGWIEKFSPSPPPPYL